MSKEKLTFGRSAESVSAQPITQPKYIRLPKPGTLCGLTGLSRTQIYLLLKAGKVRSISLRRSGRSRGCRLVDAASLVYAIEELAEAEKPAVQKEAAW